MVPYIHHFSRSIKIMVSFFKNKAKNDSKNTTTNPTTYLDRLRNSEKHISELVYLNCYGKKTLGISEMRSLLRSKIIELENK